MIIKLLLDQKEENKKVRSLVEAKIPDLKEFFPLKDSAALDRFLDQSDGLYPLRRSQFYNMLLLCVHEKQNTFGTSILKAFFSPDYIKTHRWPTYSYRTPKDKDPIVHPEFVALLKTSLARMAGEKIFPPSLIDRSFWSKWPSKFREAKRYVKKGERESDNVTAKEQQQQQQHQPPHHVQASDRERHQQQQQQQQHHVKASDRERRQQQQQQLQQQHHVKAMDHERHGKKKMKTKKTRTTTITKKNSPSATATLKKKKKMIRSNSRIKKKKQATIKHDANRKKKKKKKKKYKLKKKKKNNNNNNKKNK